MVASDTVPAGTALHPGAVSYAGDLCVNPSAYADGEHAMTVVVRDVAGESAYVPFSLRVDRRRPPRWP